MVCIINLGFILYTPFEFFAKINFCLGYRRAVLFAVLLIQWIGWLIASAQTKN